VGRRDQRQFTNQFPGQTSSEILPASDSQSHQGSNGLKHPEPTTPKVVQQEVATSIATQSTIPNLRRDRDTEKLPIKVPSPGFEVKGISPEILAD
jgi:hypothetical protein